MPYILETERLTRRFGGFIAVNNVSLRVAEGSIHALIGPNGAGKTTCFNLLTRFLSPSAGQIRFEGREITALRPEAVARLGLVRGFQISTVFASMTAFENVRVALQRERGSSRDFWRAEHALHRLNGETEELLHLTGLSEYAAISASALPYGRKRALEIATTLASRPRMMLLDEPTAGMGAEDVARTVALIRSVREGRTILMVEHNLPVVEGLCERITVLDRGGILVEGDYTTVSRDPRVRAAYLGLDADTAEEDE